MDNLPVPKEGNPLRPWQRLLLTAGEVTALWIIAWVGEALVRWAHWPVPGGLVGAGLLFLLLQSGILRLAWIEQGADWLLQELLLFYVPASVGIVQYIHSLWPRAGALLATIGLSIAGVMAITGGVAEVWSVLQRRSQTAQPHRAATTQVSARRPAP
ncbi:MAG: CidA/LrgA family protein [Alicyclobacillus sp.]|nr:CidA/LrgA family protein [Alicyclobacillus sp.]